jgi:hypothetical protein
MNKKVKIGINYRPFIKEALQEISVHYTLIVFSTNKKAYSDLIIDHIDPLKKLFKYRLYKDDCVNVEHLGEKVLIKDLRIFKTIPLSKIVIIDKSVLSFAYQIDNGIPILPFIDSKTDNELKILVSYLNYLCHYEDIREENRKVFGLENLLTNFNRKEIENEPEENCDSSGLYSFQEDSARIDSDRATVMSRVKKIEKIEPIRNLHFNFVKNNFNSNSSYESNSLLSCLILLNKGTLNYDSNLHNNTNTFLSSVSDYSKSDSENSARKFV